MPQLQKLQIDRINSEIIQDELLTTLKSCADSSPGPYGIPYSIIKLTWSIFGPTLTNSWKYALETGELTHSHENSYLKLLPKEGKDLKQLKNWRPITLSNCDFKIITKTLAKKLTEGVSSIINPNQTAYIKNRQITDNLHLLQYAIEKSTELNDGAMIVSLDAEKAFDSIEHWYIKAVLEKIGLSKFNKIFNLLYRNQMVSIQLNKHQAGSYKIKNGVKQGDALSCILFILGIEPLIKNISDDPSITRLRTDGIAIPKIVSYADDVACMVKPTDTNLQRIFDHYQTMTNTSGLKLNADKTEIITLKGNQDVYDIKYNGSEFKISHSKHIKINGLELGFDIEDTRKINFNKIYSAVEGQLHSWSNRGLSLLAKILIFKTFGLSQILFVAATTKFTKTEEAKLNNLIYKFIWNRDMSKSKAPDRIKRSILHGEVKLLGFGMIDFRQIVDSIRIKNVLRLLNDSSHPLNTIIKASLNTSIVRISNVKKIRATIDEAVTQIRKIWERSLCNTNPLDNSQDILKIVLAEYVGNVIQPKYKNQRMTILHRHDTLMEIINSNREHPILKKIDKNLRCILHYTQSDLSIYGNLQRPSHDAIPLNNKLISINKITTKMIRVSIKGPCVITTKMITNPNPEIIKALGRNIKNLTNVRLKAVFLRAIHGDVYSGTRLKKFGMSDTDLCQRCSEPETVEHQLLECQYVRELWRITSKITSIPTDNLNTVLGHNDLHDRMTITLHAEIIRNLLAIERPIINQLKLIKSITKKLSIIEKGITKFQISQMIKTLDSIT